MVMIALTTQNRRHITPHAGRCRYFMVKQVGLHIESEWELRSVAKEQTLFSCGEDLPEALRDVGVLVTAGAGRKLQARLMQLGVQVVIADILLPEQALAAWREGKLTALSASPLTQPNSGCGGACKCVGHSGKAT
ncbi:NifB/NifX family molybdenum-iron cluster-binding protein [Pseudoxanthomonas sp. Root630]|uniref:NifB/NifX family molybdenum-iron cluster-binding protein n=1 Tax=Pseudoxanthomonas sp. Root630 TaxID=1736574 RepID=UPI0012DF13E5|nr:NifB/NifX family molybdenum-iron cluster-binding protein [Pseudoxanthomonas sp. Root630]